MLTRVVYLGDQVMAGRGDNQTYVYAKVQVAATPLGDERFGMRDHVCYCREIEADADVLPTSKAPNAQFTSVLKVLVPEASDRFIESLAAHEQVFRPAFAQCASLNLPGELEIRFSS